MVAFNFQKQFVPKILAGTKTQTFRATRRCEVGDDLQLYVGQRTKQCEKLFDTTCIGVYAGAIHRDKVEFTIDYSVEEALALCENFAVKDGFQNWNELTQFFEGQGRKFPFYGFLHKWLAPAPQLDALPAAGADPIFT